MNVVPEPLGLPELTVVQVDMVLQVTLVEKVVPVFLVVPGFLLSVVHVHSTT